MEYKSMWLESNLPHVKSLFGDEVRKSSDGTHIKVSGEVFLVGRKEEDIWREMEEGIWLGIPIEIDGRLRDYISPRLPVVWIENLPDPQYEERLRKEIRSHFQQWIQEKTEKRGYQRKIGF